MSNGKPWLPGHTELLKQHAGILPDCAIAQLTGHTRRTIEARRQQMGLPPYQWNRTEYSTWDTLTPEQRAAIKRGT